MISSLHMMRTTALAVCAAVLPQIGLAESPGGRAPQGDLATRTASVAERLRNYDRVTIDPRAAVREVKETGTLAFETSYGSFTVELSLHDLKAARYRAVAEGGGQKVALSAPQVRTFRGRAYGLRDAEARFTIDESTLTGVIIASDETYFLEPLRNYEPNAAPTEFLFYRGSDVIADPSLTCGTLAEAVAEAKGFVDESLAGQEPALATTSYRVLEIATEADYEYVQAHGGATGANAEILSILNQVEGVYQNELGLTFDVVYQNAWTGSDPYSSADASTMLTQFRNYWNQNKTGIKRDATHMWTGKDMTGSTIGIAYVGVICASASYSYGVSQRLSSAPQKYILTAHELGHNFSAQHSDGQTGCSNTVMQSSVGTGFTFCSFSRNQIGTWVNGHTSCVPYGTTGGSTLSAPTGLSASSSTSSISLSWTDPNTAESGYRIERKAGAGGVFALLATVGANVSRYTDSTASAGTTYYYRVKAYASTSESAYSNEASATIQGSTGGEIVANGTFELGAVSWLQTVSGIINSSSTTPAFAGSWEATLLGRGYSGSATLYQSPSFPASSSTSRTLRFYLRINSSDTRAYAYDRLYVRVANRYGSTLKTLASFSNMNRTAYGNYALVTVTIPAQYCVAGNQIRFFAREDYRFATAFSIDNVSIQ